MEISSRGIVRYLVKPNEGDMYTGWQRLKGDVSKTEGGVIVWAARNPEMLKMFDGETVASIPVQ